MNLNVMSYTYIEPIDSNSDLRIFNGKIDGQKMLPRVSKAKTPHLLLQYRRKVHHTAKFSLKCF